RHAALAALGEQLDDEARPGIARHDRLVAGAALAERLVAGDLELALFLLGVVAGEAVFLEDRRDVVDEADRALGRLGPRRGGEQHEPGERQSQRGAEEAIAARRAGAEHREL